MCFNTKKIISVIVSAALLLSLSGNVFAEEAMSEMTDAVTEINAEESTEVETVEETEETVEIEATDETGETTESTYLEENAFDVNIFSATGGIIIDEYNGMGTAEYPYKIRTAEQFMSIGTKGYVTEALDRTYSWSAHYILMNDIEVSSDDYVPIGDHYGSFAGIFDGDGHTIYFTYSGGDYQGLFGINGGTIKNLTVSGDITGGYQFGMIAGINNGIIENCFTSGTVTGKSYIGGMVGINSGTITASGSDATVTGESYAGGLLGGASSGTVLNSYALGNVSHVNGGGSEGFGGLVGGAGPYGMSTVIRNCYAAGEVGGGSGGGLVGLKIDSNPEVYNSYYHNINKLNGKGFPVTAEELRDKDTFYMWDFDNIWAIDEGGYPYINLRGETPEVEFEGDGTEKNPYLIKTEKQLHALAMKKNGIEEGVYYRLENDIEVSAKFWMPINSYYTSYSGTFDGNGHTISGIHIWGINKHIGLFANIGINGVVKNLTVSGDISNRDGTYLAYYDSSGILAGTNYGTIENCFSEGSVYGRYAGGLIGVNESKGVVRYCGSNADVTSDYEGGGLVGESDGMIINSYARGDVSGNSDRLGGLVSNNDGTVKYCYASGTVNGGNGGGLIGTGISWGEGYDSLYNSYYHSVNTKNDGGFPMTTDELKDKNTYYMWDFDNIWAIDEGGYPYIDIRGETPAVTFEGDGDADSPYLIKTEKQLYALSMDEASIGSGIHYQLANDIELTAKYWTPIKIHAYGSTGFSGVFDGNGYTISGVRNNTISKYNGLFGYNSGTIKNLKVTGEINSDTGNKGYYTGILVGNNKSGAVIENCYTEGTVKGGVSVGGLVGSNYGTVKESGSVATVTGRSGAGGLAGDSEGAIVNCYAQGDVTSNDNGGGLVGDYYANNKATIINCYSTGLVNGGSGYCLVGEESSSSTKGVIYNSYTIDTNNNTKNHYYMNGFVVSEEELKDKDTFYMWDFDNIWAIDEGGYPYIDKRGETPAVTFKGEGDVQTPYLVETEEQLHALAMGKAPVGNGIYYQLANDIELTAKYWTPICMNDEFKGEFDGNGYTISNVKSSLINKYVGLFGKNNGTIKNLNVTGTVTVPCDGYAYGANALLAGFNNTNGVIENCGATGTADGTYYVGLLVGSNSGVVKNSTASGEASGEQRVGLLAGYNNNSIENCVANGIATGKYYAGGLVGYSDGSITSSGADAEVYGMDEVGGLVGRGNCNITGCYARGSVTATGDSAGGLVGYSYKSSALISDSNAITQVSGDENVGGLVGYARTKIDKCFAKGSVTGKSLVGGLVGTMQEVVTLSSADVEVSGSGRHLGGLFGKICYGTAANCYSRGNVTGTGEKYSMGGLAGHNDNSTIEYCYSTGSVSTGGSSVGGLVGSVYGAGVKISNSYYNAETSGMPDNGKGIGMTTAEMKLATSYTDWDYTDVWAISNDTNDGYPYLRALAPDFGRGDVNGDKSIDNKDATYLLRYLTSWTIPGLVQEALDVDGNGEIDNKDATVLLRYLAGWEITLD